MSTRLRTSASVLALALALTACGGDDATETDTTTDTSTAAETGDTDGEAAATTLDVSGTDQLSFEPTALTAAAGEVTFNLTSGASVNHNIVIEELDMMVVEAAAGATESATVTLEAGSYVFFCDVPGHRAAGMEGTLEVA